MPGLTGLQSGVCVAQRGLAGRDTAALVHVGSAVVVLVRMAGAIAL